VGRRATYGFVGCIVTVLLAGCSGEVTCDTSDPGGEATANLGVRAEAGYGEKVDGDLPWTMPNSIGYANRPLPVRITADNVARTFPTSRGPELECDSHEGPWRWTIKGTPTATSQQVSSIPLPDSSWSGGSSSYTDEQGFVVYTTSPRVDLSLFEGEWTAELARLSADGTPEYWKSKSFVVVDYVVVQLGDSYGSGEGAPDRTNGPQRWGDAGTEYGQQATARTHAQAHRSSRTWGSHVANIWETLNSSSSVTFLNLAESGALTGDVAGQLADMRKILGSREPDLVLVSAGGNDAGFSQLIAGMIAREPIGGTTVDLPMVGEVQVTPQSTFGPSLGDLRRLSKNGEWAGKGVGAWFTDAGSVWLEILDSWVPSELDWTNVKGLDGLPVAYASMAESFLQYGIPPERVFILEYPDPFMPNPNDPYATCGPVIDEAYSFIGRNFEIGAREQSEVAKPFLRTLNQEVTKASEKYGWTVIQAEAAFAGHSVCDSSDMVNSNADSKRDQGDVKGMLHPNAEGFEEIGNLVVNESLFR